MKGRTIVGVLITIFLITFSNKIVHADETTDIKVTTHHLKSNDIKISNASTPTEVYHEIARQYKNKYPNYEGAIRAYTRNQYANLKAGRSTQYIDEDYLKRCDLFSTIQTRAEVSAVSSRSFPYSSIGRPLVWYSLPNGVMIMQDKSLSVADTSTQADINYYDGSAFLIRKNRIGTAAHLFWDASLGLVDGAQIGFYRSPVNDAGFIYNGNLNNIRIPSTYESNPNSNFSMDIATADISTVGVPTADAPTTYFTVSQTNANTQSNVKSLGYPGGSVSGTVYGDTFTLMQSTGSVYPANENTKVYGPIDYYESDSARSHHGMSGGPLLNSSNQVIGINAYEWHHTNDDGSAGAEYKWGFRRITSTVYDFLMAL